MDGNIFGVNVNPVPDQNEVAQVQPSAPPETTEINKIITAERGASESGGEMMNFIELLAGNGFVYHLFIDEENFRITNELFALLDRDNSNSLDSNDFKNMGGLMNMNSDQWEFVRQTMDINSDGKVSGDEFRQLFIFYAMKSVFQPLHQMTAWDQFVAFKQQLNIKYREAITQFHQGFMAKQNPGSPGRVAAAAAT
jgi:hypothetical protein